MDVLLTCKVRINKMMTIVMYYVTVKILDPEVAILFGRIKGKATVIYLLA
jgi:hypothetical protein